MTKSNPMEPLFIGMVEKIVEEIFRDHADEDERTKILATLQSHLEKAKRLGTLLYEGETHNAIFIYKFMNGGSRDEMLISLNAAYDCAKRANDIPLQLKILNNKGAFFNQEFKFTEARRYFDEAIQINATINPPMVGGLFAYGNRIADSMRSANWQSAVEDIEVVDKVSRKVQVTSINRNDYARSLQIIRSHEVIVNLATGQHEAALSALKMTQTLVAQLNIKGHDNALARLEALYALIAEGDTDSFEAWHTQRLNEISVTNAYVEVALLHTVGQEQYATQIAKLAFDATPKDAQSKSQAIFETLGVDYT